MIWWSGVTPVIPGGYDEELMSAEMASDTMTYTASSFLTAEWRYLAMLNFQIDPAVLRPLLPSGTELDAWNDRHFVSLVGFMFLNARIRGVAFPCHRDFEEVNLRFYVRRKVGEQWRRAVVFVKELVPRSAIALTARVLYGEMYSVLPMDHYIQWGKESELQTVSYRWRFRGRQNHMTLSANGCAFVPPDGSDIEFVTEHYWGYTRRRDGRTSEYRVDHPRWPVRIASDTQLDCDVAALYGAHFAEYLHGTPASAFVAEGSPVAVFRAMPVFS